MFWFPGTHKTINFPPCAGFKKWVLGTRTGKKKPGIELNGQVPANPGNRYTPMNFSFEFVYILYTFVFNDKMSKMFGTIKNIFLKLLNNNFLCFCSGIITNGVHPL